jgi:hypothetical protein
MSNFLFVEFLLRNRPGFDELEISEFFVVVFKLSAGQQLVECDVSEVLGAKCGHSKLF